MRRPPDIARAAVDLLSTLVVLALAVPMWLSPLPVAIVLGRFGGLVGFLVWGRARRAGMINLRRAFGAAMDRRSARRAVRRVFLELGRSIAEGIYASRAGTGRLRVSIENEALARSIREDPRPKVFVTGHLGSWEAALMTVRDVGGIDGSVIARGVDNPFLDAVVRHVRFRHPAELIDKFGASDESLATLRSGKSVAMLLDENGGPRGPFVPFFGRPASTRKTAALLAAATGAQLVVGAAVRRAEGLLLRLAVVDPPRDGSRAELVAATARITAVLETWIREDPLQWRWIHWRWKSRPDGSEESYDRRDVDECFRELGVTKVSGMQVERPG